MSSQRKFYVMMNFHVIQIRDLALLVIFTFTLASTISQLHTLNNTSSPFDFSPSISINCIKLNFASPRYLTVRSCALAIHELPSTSTVAYCHIDGPNDGYKFPVSRTVGRCQVNEHACDQGPK